MARLFYQLSIYLYQVLITLVSPFNTKAKQWINGRKHQRLEHQSNVQTAWFHCASLGEFEQGRPVIEAFRANFPHYRIVLTFFSPSGYEVRKNYEGADVIAYLPLDTETKAREFIETIQPSVAFFVKYEFWYHYLRILKEKQILVLSFSAIFRPNQVFFKSYGGFYRAILHNFSHIFVQNQVSFDLLQSIGIPQISIGGDTRFDRVKQIADAKKQISVVEQFKNAEKLLIVGSCWQEDFQVFMPFLNTFKEPLKVIIAPHEIHSEEIESWRKQLHKKSIRFSEITTNQLVSEVIAQAEVLFIDNIGMLSSLYQYAEFAWIGGAYKKGLHNTLEAATFGLPIFFGDKAYKRFQEANDLIEIGGAMPIDQTATFQTAFETLYFNENKRLEKATIIKNYVAANLGGTTKIIDFLKKSQL